jgi:hypothetical protein
MKLAHDPLPLDFGRDKEFCVYVYRDPRHRRLEPIYVGEGQSAPAACTERRTE